MGTNKGFFLHDFFGRILPGDRNLFTPILEFIKWRRLTKNLGLLSWVALWLAVCGLLSFSFLKNVSVIHGFTEDFSKPPALTDNISNDLLIMDKFRDELEELHDANSGWWVPRFGLKKSIEIENRLKKQYASMLEKGFLNPMDREVEKKLQLVTTDTPGIEIMVYAEHLVARIILLEAHLQGKSFKSSDYVFRTLPHILTLIDRSLLPEIAAKFGDIYFYYLDYGINKEAAGLKLKELQTALGQLIGKKSANLYWLVEWANAEPSITHITLKEFWGPGGPEEPGREIKVNGAFTIDGHKQIGEFIEHLQKALPDAKNITGKKKEFNLWYRQKYFQEWKDFACSFSEGQFNLNGPDERQTMASRMTTPQNPYFGLVRRMNHELKPFADRKDVPAWVPQLIEVQSVITLATEKKKAKEDKSILARVVHKGEELAHEASEKVKTSVKKDLSEKHLHAADAFNAYTKNLAELLPVSSARSQAYKAASEFFPYSLKPSESKSPFFSAFGEIQKFKTYFASGGDSSVSLKLLSGPLRFLVHYVSMETACSLQHDWEDIVLGGIQGVSKNKLPDLLFGKEGSVWKFVNGPAAPFLGRNQNGYFAKKARGVRIPFDDDFFTFITQGGEISTSIQPEYKVQVNALPIDVNNKAKTEPYAVVLMLHCTKKKTILKNYNHPASQMFAWSPEDCGDVTLQIHFEGFTLTKEYTGYNGFPLFLADFKGGSKTFTPRDFPGYKGILQKINVNEIKISYEFTDSKPVIQLLEKVPRQIPRFIATCWDR
jgi:type VI secretion system protein ImpL